MRKPLAGAVFLFSLLLASGLPTAQGTELQTPAGALFLTHETTPDPRGGESFLMRATPGQEGVEDVALPLLDHGAAAVGAPRIDPATTQRTWLAEPPLPDDHRFVGPVQVRLDVALEAHVDAWLTVTIEAVAHDGRVRPVAEEALRLGLPASDRTMLLMLDPGGSRLMAGDRLALTVSVEGASVLHWLRYGDLDHPSGISHMRLVRVDTDRDGLGDGHERRLGTDWRTTDTDGDGVGDGVEVARGSDPLHADQPRSLQARGDRDRDGLADAVEQRLATDPNEADTDGDGAVDGIEERHDGDPLDARVRPVDSDRDGLPDDFERAHGLDPMRHDPDGDMVPDGSADPDRDGLVNLDEAAYGTDPNDPDTDGDGRSDGLEVARGSDPLVADASGGPVTATAVSASVGLGAAAAGAALRTATSGLATTRGVTRPFVGTALGANGVLLVAFWILSWGARGEYVATVLALQAFLLLVVVGVVASRRLGAGVPGQQAPSVGPA